MHRFTPSFSTRALRSRRSPRRAVAVLTALALTAGVAGLTGANAATTITPAPAESGTNGPVVRNDSIDLNVSGAQIFTRTATGNYSPASNILTAALSGCVGDNPAGTNRSPRSRVVVTGPGGVVLDATSPVRSFGSATPASPQPAPNNTNYRGTGPATQTWPTKVSLAGRPSGVYTVQTIVTNTVKTLSLTAPACAPGTPNTGPSGALTNTFTAGPVTESWTFEYRPWQEQFTDLLGTGTIRMNTTPREFQFDVSNAASPIVSGAAGAAAMQLYSLPNSARVQLSIPNPGACGTDPLGCLPEAAVACDPAQGCRPRLATINYDGGATKLTGLFDIETKAFAAVATAGGRTRVLLSGGAEVDSALRGVLGELNGLAGQLGVDLPALLGTAVNLNVQRPDGSTDVIQISLLRMIEIFNVPNGPATGVSVLSPLSIGAGVITHFGTWVNVASPVPIDPAARDAAGVDHSGFGYRVTEASALPAIPALPAPVGALVPPGKLKHITGKIPANSGGHIVAIGVDTDYDAASGLPLHLPLASTPGLVPDRGIDFVGAATVLLNAEVCFPGFGCLGGAAMLGTGVATFGTSPLPVNLGSLPLIWGDELGLGTVVAPLDGLIADVSTSLLTNPAVTGLLGTLTPLLGDLPVGSLPLQLF